MDNSDTWAVLCVERVPDCGSCVECRVVCLARGCLGIVAKLERDLVANSKAFVEPCQRVTGPLNLHHSKSRERCGMYRGQRDPQSWTVQCWHRCQHKSGGHYTPRRTISRRNKMIVSQTPYTYGTSRGRSSLITSSWMVGGRPIKQLIHLSRM